MISLYIDPGTGSLIITSLIALFVTLKNFFLNTYYRIIFFFKKKKFKLKNDFSDHLVFFSEGKKYWSVFKPVIENLVNKKVSLVFLSADSNDPGLKFLSKHIASIQSHILSKFGWTYILAMTVFVCVSLFLMVSKFGDIKLGQEHDVPEYTSISWVSMLFAAGMGIGLMFYGVGEPLKHFISPPYASADQFELTKEAMNITFFHQKI